MSIETAIVLPSVSSSVIGQIPPTESVILSVPPSDGIVIQTPVVTQSLSSSSTPHIPGPESEVFTVAPSNAIPNGTSIVSQSLSSSPKSQIPTGQPSSAGFPVGTGTFRATSALLHRSSFIPRYSEPVGAVGSGPTTSGNSGLIAGMVSGLLALVALGVVLWWILVKRKDDKTDPDNDYETETEIAEEPLDQEELALTSEDLLFGDAEIDQNLTLNDIFGQNPEELQLFF
jgi:hypothetical protein